MKSNSKKKKQKIVEEHHSESLDENTEFSFNDSDPPDEYDSYSPRTNNVTVT